jgi:exodeoxyribonuclease V beta subunit
MSTENKFENFRASDVRLEGSNLIEASAGTGKTYSIAILVLRLIIEEKFSIREILMVTFTKAAVAELEERIRLFIRSAYKVSNNEKIEDTTISELVDSSIKNNGREEVSRILREAVIYLDETSVLTIHSFCQQTLIEFAFETNQLFGIELLQDISAIIEEEVNKFWRKNITTINTGLLAYLLDAGLSRAAITGIVQQHLDGKRFHVYDGLKDYTFCEDDHLNLIKEIRVLADKEKELRNCLIQNIIGNSKQLKEKALNDTNGRKHILHLIDEPQDFLDAIIKKRSSGYIIKLFGDILNMSDQCDKAREEITGKIRNCINRIYCLAIHDISHGINKNKLYNNQVSFDDLIENLHTALVKKDNPKLVDALQRKYKAVFIDEFQDTDRLQYEIFKTAFGKGTVLFYIGDPKQSIYAWRKADIFTYFKACNDVEYRYGMNENFRSSEKFIEAMNVFFQPEKDFNTFYFPADEQSITYIPVISPAINTMGQLSGKGGQCVPISVNTQPNKDSIVQAVTAQVIELLSNRDYVITKNEKRSLKPSDIGILVRSNKEAETVKISLAKYGIPAVTISNDKVLQSAEATALLYVLEAMLDISRSHINRALLSSFTGYTVQHILSLDDETIIELFKKYKTNWDEDGIYTALVNFISDFGVHQVLLQKNTENGERIITNLTQLVELLYKIQATKKLSQLELIDWLKRGIERNDVEGDEYEQRVENDEEAVKIVTIHNSKGLQYNIVIAPFLDFTERKNDTFSSYRDPGTGEYIHIEKVKLSPGQQQMYRQQTEQENRRLLYVAITRAVYKCFIYRNAYFRESTLSVFTNALKSADPLINENQYIPEIPPAYFYRKSLAERPEEPTPVQFSLLQNNWTRMSYTMLAAEVEKGAKGKSGNYKDQYGYFIFNRLLKGNKTGNMLHYIFENLHFTNNERWPAVINTAIKRFAPSHKEEYAPKLMEMLQHVLHADIHTRGISFNLGEVGYDQRVHEFEFDFPVTVFEPGVLENLSDEKISVYVKDKYKLEGIMNGKIDLLFECKEKYFILDWKSTYLGDRVEDYAAPALDEAMNENNYHLQYLIYTLAAKKYLHSRLPGFDYERDFGGVLYLFIRGMRKGTSNGIFTCKPSSEQIDTLDRIFSETLLLQLA